MPLPSARRDSGAYRLTAVKGQREPSADIPVHFMNSDLTVICRKRSAGMRLKTTRVGNVTCPACLKKLKSLESSHA